MFSELDPDGSRKLQDRYERLRWEGKQKAMSHELVVFLTEGMFAWMQAWSSLPVKTVRGCGQGGRSGLNKPKNKATHLIGIRKEVVNILANMSLEKLKGDGI